MVKNMSDVFKYSSEQVVTINTNEGQSKIVNYEVLPIYADTLPMLSNIMPEFDFSNPTINPIDLIGSLKVTMKAYGGIGLAANQCNIPVRCFVIQSNDKVIACFNPKVIECSSFIGKMSEGCLSFPGMNLTIERPLSIKVQYQDEKGVLMQGDFSGLTARCFLHELDHLNGIKFTKHVGKTTLMMAKKKQEKLIRNVKKQKRSA